VSIAGQKRAKANGNPLAHLSAFSDRRRDPDGKKEAVLLTAVQIFIAKGYRQTSLDDVAEKLRITKPALYYYFKNKEEIYLECYRRGVALTQESLERLRAHAGSGLEKVAGFIQTYTVIVARDFGRFLVRQDGRELSPKAQAEVRAEKRKIDRTLRVFIEQGIKDGSIRPCNVKLAAFSLAGAIHSLATWFEPGGELTAEEVATEFAQTLTQGLANGRRAKLRIPAFEPIQIAPGLSNGEARSQGSGQKIQP
jgi:AcrR family transcriptional regulator